MGKFTGKIITAAVMAGTVALSGACYAAAKWVRVEAGVRPVHFMVDGKTASTGQQAEDQFFNGRENVPAALDYKDTVYIPVRLAGEWMGKKVGWDAKSGSVVIGTTPSSPGGGGKDSSAIVAGTLEPSLQLKMDGTDGPEFVFTVKNQTEKVQTLTFNSGLKMDYVLEDQNGKVVKRFSDDRAAVQVIQQTVLKQGEELSFSESLLNLNLSKGQYTITFMLMDQEFKPKASKTFEVSDSGTILSIK